MDSPITSLDDSDPLKQPVAQQLAANAFPHVTLTGEELTALVAATETGVDTSYDLTQVLTGHAYWRTGRVLARPACQVLQRLERRNRDAAPEPHRQQSRTATRVGTPLDTFERRGQAFVRRRRPRGGSRDGWIDLPLDEKPRLINL
jgi:hypothetical protein